MPSVETFLVGQPIFHDYVDFGSCWTRLYLAHRPCRVHCLITTRGLPVLRPLMASNCCHRGRRGAPKWYVSVFLILKRCVVFFCQFIVNYCVCRSPTAFADGQFARIHHAASGMLLVTCKWCHCCRCWALHGVSGVPIGALLVVLQQWLADKKNVIYTRRTYMYTASRLDSSHAHYHSHTSCRGHIRLSWSCAARNRTPISKTA